MHVVVNQSEYVFSVSGEEPGGARREPAACKHRVLQRDGASARNRAAVTVVDFKLQKMRVCIFFYLG